LSVKQLSSTGAVTQTTYSPRSGPQAKAPSAGKYWDGISSTNFYNVPPYIAAPPNPQVAVGPDDIFTIVNRTIARYPNPNALGNSLVSNPYNNPPTSQIWLDTWLGITDLNTLCPTVAPARTNATCQIDNASVRYDQLQGRFLVLMTVSDVPAHISNFVLIVSRFATFTQGTTGTNQLFTAPIAPIVGGTGTGGVLSANWVRYIIPVNVVLPGGGRPGENGNTTATNLTAFCTTPNLGGDPASLPPSNTAGAGPITSGCSNYFPTSARLGLDNDNIILAAPVLDGSQAPFPNPTLNAPQLPGGPYAGTRVVTVPKMVVYNGTALPLVAANVCAPNGCGAINLSDNTATGTLTATTGNPAPTPGNIPAVFWEPDNLRGRALASFNSQVGPAGNADAGIISPVAYLVGTLITDLLTGANYTPNLTGGDLTLLVQPIVFTCPGTAIFSGPLGVTFCGVAGGGANGQVPDLPVLGPLKTNASSIAIVGDPAPVGQSNANDGTSMVNRRLFVGDSRPQQVIFREGLLYVARAVRTSDSSGNALGTSTVMYHILRQECQYTTSLPGAITATATSITVANAAAAQIPSSTPPLPIVIQIDGEKLRVTARTGNTLTVVRGVENTVGAAHIAGSLVVNLSIACPAYSTDGSTLPDPSLVMETSWFNGQNVPDPTGNLLGYGFYGPMFDVPANVISSGPVSPISLFPWFEKLFVGMTTGGTANVANTFNNNHPSLWDFRPGDDAYDTTLPYLNPYTGVTATVIAPCNATNTITSCPMVPFGTRGGAATDPNDGSLWLYGQFAKNRMAAIPGPGQWGTSIANYALDFPVIDPYNNDNAYFADVPPSSPFFTWIQIAKNLGIAIPTGTNGPCPATPPGNPPIQPPPAPGTTPTPGSSSLVCPNFGPSTFVTRSEMARWVVLGQMDDEQVDSYLAATGGNPQNDVRFATFADTVSPNDPNLRYIEVMARRGYTKGCGNTNDGRAAYCPTRVITRGEMSVFLIRAKMNNVFPTTLSGIPLTSPYGDNFGLFTPATAYFTDVPSDHIYSLYIQKMRELRISNGTGATTYSPDDPLTREQIATFIVRAFFL
jgi:hypothetical protein